MSLPYRARPGAGFIVLAVSLIGAVSFFAWGFATPPLEDVWRIQIELSLGERSYLSDSDFRLLQDTLRRYPALADNMLEDRSAGLVSANQDGIVNLSFAYLVRTTPEAPGKLGVTSIGDEPAVLNIRTIAASRSGRMDHNGQVDTWQIPNSGPFPQLIEVRLTSDAEGDAKQKKKKNPVGQSDDKAHPMLVTLKP